MGLNLPIALGLLALGSTAHANNLKDDDRLYDMPTFDKDGKLIDYDCELENIKRAKDDYMGGQC